VTVDDALRVALERSLGSRIDATAPVHGGDVAIAYRLDLADGRRVFAKTHRDPPPDFFTTEAAGLTWLRDAGTIAVPEVLTVSDDAPAHLVLGWIDRGPARAATEAELGRALAGLHRAGPGPSSTPPSGSSRSPGSPVTAAPCPSPRVPPSTTPRSGSIASSRRRSLRLASTAISGPATVWSTPRATAGSSTRPRTAATVSSTSR
jgi:hypothetical protein